MKNKDDRNLSKNFGYLFLEKFYDLLQLPKFFAEHRKSRANYDLNEIFFFLVVMRVLDPDSKRAAFMECKTLYQKEFPFHLADVYRALDEIAELKDEMEAFLNRRIAELLPRDESCLYLDATFYTHRVLYSFSWSFSVREDVSSRGAKLRRRANFRKFVRETL